MLDSPKWKPIRAQLHGAIDHSPNRHGLHPGPSRRAAGRTTTRTVEDRKLSVLVLAPSRTAVAKIRISGVEVPDLYRLGDFHWLIPTELLQSDEGLAQLEGLMGPETTEFIGTAGEIWEWELESRREEAHRAGQEVSLAFAIRLLNCRLLEATAMGALANCRRQFLGLDFLTLVEIQALRPVDCSLADLLQLVSSKYGHNAWPRGVDPQLKAILSFYLERREATPLIRPIYDVLVWYLGRRLDPSNTTIQYTHGWPGHRPYPKQELSNALLVLGNYFIDSLNVMSAGHLSKLPRFGLTHEFDLLAFGAGALAMGKGNGHEIINCEPNGLLFFAFAEFFLMLASAPEADRKWSCFAATAVAAEQVYVEHYRNDLTTPKAQDYTWHNGPFENRGGMKFVTNVLQSVAAIDGSVDRLLDEHQRILRSALGSSPGHARP